MGHCAFNGSETSLVLYPHVLAPKTLKDRKKQAVNIAR
jgi:hypothetical protein